MSRRSYINHASNQSARNPFKSLLRLIQKISRKILDICSKILYNALHGRISVFRKTHRNTTLHNGVLQETPSYATLLREAYRLRSVVTQVLRKVLKVFGFQTAFKFLVRTTRKGDGKMNKFSFVRKLGLAASLLTVLVLAGCAGGGSDVTLPTPVAGNVAITVSPTDNTKGVARDSKVTLTYASTTKSYASSTGTLSCDGNSLVLTQSTDTVTQKVTFAPATVLPYGSTCIGQGTSTASGLDGGASTTISWKTTFVVEADPVLHYTDKVYALWTDKYPHAVTRSGVTKVKNMTQWNGLGKDLFLCFIANHPLADGKILTLCKDLAGMKWHTLYIDPTKDEMYEYTGTVPADLVYTVDPDSGIPAASLGASWLDVDKPTAAHPQWNSFAKVTDGYYYTEIGSSGGLLKFIGNDGAVSIIADKNPLVNGIGTIQVMWSYNN